MAFGEFWDSIKSTFETRAKSSFVGSFILAWSAINWKSLYVTFILSTDELPYREAAIRYPDKLSYLGTLPHDMKHLLWWPLAAAAVTPLAILVADEVVGLIKTGISQGALWVNQKVLKTKLADPKDYKLRRRRARAS